MAQSPDVRIVTETALSDYDTTLQGGLSTTIGAAISTTLFAPDPDDPGTFTHGGLIAEDLADPGTYLIGA